MNYLEIATRLGVTQTRARELVYLMARKEHAWLLRAEGKTHAEIATRIGVSRERARQLVYAFGSRVNRAWRKRVKIARALRPSDSTPISPRAKSPKLLKQQENRP